MAEIVLFQMPFASAHGPSIGLSLLKAALERVGVDANVKYVNHDFSDIIGHTTYDLLSAGAPQSTDMLGEWVFTEALWGEDRARDAAYFNDIIFGGNAAHRKSLSSSDLAKFADAAKDARRSVVGFILGCLDGVDWDAVKIVGFTSVFQQHVASLALAKILKARYPKLHIVFGGANCEGAMGQQLFTSFPFVDAVFSGEADETFPLYVQAFLVGKPVSLPGVLSRVSTSRPAATPALRSEIKTTLNALPYANFDDFFAQRPRDTVNWRPRLMFETSRGCWWGQKNHCTFCGLNGQGMKFRAKSPARALEEFKWLLDRYGHETKSFSATDNIIPLEYIQQLLPKLSDLGVNFEIFYETKANLRKDQLEVYANAGLREIQPGIESMITPVLRLMRKGVSALQNIQLLKQCKQYSMTPHWNYLYGFPQEVAAWYEGQSDLIRSLHHLTPPIASAQVRFDRFSPYVDAPEEHGLANLAPYPSYAYIYPHLDDAARANLAYFFTAEHSGKSSAQVYVGELERALVDWRARAPTSFLLHLPVDDDVLVFDGRTGGRPKLFCLKGPVAAVFSICDSITGTGAINAAVAECSPGLSAADVAACLKILLRHGLVVQERDSYLTLSVELWDAVLEHLPDEARHHLRTVFHLAEGGDDGADATSTTSIEAATILALEHVTI